MKERLLIELYDSSTESYIFFLNLSFFHYCFFFVFVTAIIIFLLYYLPYYAIIGVIIHTNFKDIKSHDKELNPVLLHFANDYLQGAHPDILKALLTTNNENLAGYGEDHYCASAKEKILAACHSEDGDVYLLSGGTQTNQVVIAALLQSYESVISADIGHIALHEAGAIEYSGHKVVTLKEQNGKLTASAVEDYLTAFYQDESHCHMPHPGMVYISHPTEFGTLYSKKELTDLSLLCRNYHIPLFIDGARLGYGLASPESDLSLPDIARLSDVFYIGGTKVGALSGEAIVFPKKETVPQHFKTIIKQHGALLAKGRLLGVQFDTLFSNNLYLTISQQAIDTAELLRHGLRKKGYQFFIDSPTNQQFIILENKFLESLNDKVTYTKWEPYDNNHTVIRLVTSWYTKKEEVTALLNYF